jgi:hypothetical protein
MVRGGCLCGAIRFEADSVPLISNCHCSKCRKAVGSAFRATACVPLAQFRVLRGEDQIQVYQPSGPGYSNAFCRRCGSNAPWVVEERQLALIPAGLLEDDPGVRPALHMFVGSKAPWWEITDAAPQFEEWVPGFGPDGDR